MKVLAWIIGIPVGLFVLVLLSFFVKALLDPDTGSRAAAKRKEECTRAIASSMGTSTRGYQDREAYRKRVADACEGMEIDGKPVADLVR